MKEQPSEDAQDPSTVLSHLQHLHTVGQFREAADISAGLIARWPHFYPLYVIRGRSLLALGEFEAAVPPLLQALELHPGEKNALTGVAKCLRHLGRNDDALPYLAESYYLRPTAAAANILLRAAFNATEQDPELMFMLLRDFYPDYFANHPTHEIVITPFVAMAEWCAGRGIAMDEYDPGGEMRLRGADGTPVTPYFAPPVRFATIPAATVVAGLDWVIAPTGELLDGSGLTCLADSEMVPYGAPTAVPGASDPPRKRIMHARSRDTIHIDQDVVFLSAPRLHHFGHWIYDHLPRLIALRWPGRIPLKVFSLATLPRAHREALDHFGIQPDDLILGEDGQAYQFRSVTALQLGDTQRPAAGLAKFLHDALAIKHTPAPSGVRGGRYFLERSQTSRGRKIANQEEFQAILDEFGFQSVRRPELTVPQQDVLFSDASIILSPFGSDLVTYFQLRPGTDFIVLNFKDMEEVYPEIEQLALRYCALLGMRYHGIYCDIKEREGKILYHGDILVDCAALRRTLAEIVARHGERIQ